MLLARKLVLSMLMWLGIGMLFILLLLQPGRVDFDNYVHEAIPKYTFSMSEYNHNIQLFLKDIKNNRGLGETKLRTPVSEEVVRHMSRSIKPIILAFVISVLLGVLKGIFDFRKAKTKMNGLGKGTTWFFQSIPDFVIIIGITWILLFLIQLGFPQFSIYGYDKWYSIIIPTIILSVFPTMYIARITASKMEEQEGELYIRTAQAKGLNETTIIYKHMLGNCWSTILSHFSSILMYILSNLLVVEYLLYYKGGAYRLLEAFGFSDTVAPYSNVIEVNVALGLGFSFMALIIISQVISQVAEYYFNPLNKGEL
jgi:oligopeptide transport system permease protein